MLTPLILKSITLEDSGKSSHATIQRKALGTSALLGALTNVPLPGKTTYVPFLEVPKVTDTSFVVGGLTLTKKTHQASGTLTDETLEDSNVPLSPVLEDLLAMQLRLKLESDVTAKLKADVTPSVLTGVAPTAPATVIGLLGALDPLVFDNSPIIVTCSHARGIELVASTEIKNLVTAGIVTIAPCTGMTYADIVVLHSHGAKIGYEATALEVDRSPGSQLSTVYVQGTLGSAFSPTYVKRAVI